MGLGGEGRHVSRIAAHRQGVHNPERRVGKPTRLESGPHRTLTGLGIGAQGRVHILTALGPVRQAIGRRKIGLAVHKDKYRSLA